RCFIGLVDGSQRLEEQGRQRGCNQPSRSTSSTSASTLASPGSGSVSSVSSSVLRLERITGQPSRVPFSISLSGTKSSWINVSLTLPPNGSMSNDTFESGSLMSSANCSSLQSNSSA